MIALLNPTVWLVALALMLSSYAGGRWQQYQSDRKDQVAALLKESEKARAKEAAWQSDAQSIEEVHSEELRRVAAQHVRDLAGVRRNANRLPDTATCTADGTGATGRQLSQPDAEFLIGLATDADRTAADLRTCQAWIQIVTKEKP